MSMRVKHSLVLYPDNRTLTDTTTTNSSALHRPAVSAYLPICSVYHYLQNPKICNGVKILSSCVFK